MRLRGMKLLFGGVVLFSLQLASAVSLNAQSNDQAPNMKIGTRAICHYTGNASSPYELITVLPGAGAKHSGHGDVKPENGACPNVLPMSWSDGSSKNGRTAIRKSRASSASAGNSSIFQSGEKSEGINPTEEDKKVAICHQEGNGEYRLNTVSQSSVAAHFGHGDLYPEGGMCLIGDTGADGGVEPGATPEPITMLLFGVGLAGVGYVSRRRLAGRSAEGR